MQAIPRGLVELVARLDTGGYEKLEEKGPIPGLLVLKYHFLTGFFLGRPLGRMVNSKSNVLAMCSTHVTVPKGSPRLKLQSN